MGAGGPALPVSGMDPSASAGPVEYSCAAEPPVQYRLSHLSRRSEPLIKHTICMMRVYSRNALSNPYTIKGIQESKIKAGLIKVVNECWNAFNSKMYAICATSLLSVIEGILSEFSDDKQDVRMMKVCQKHVDTFPSDGSTIMKYVWISYNQFIRNLYQKSDFTADEPEAINRHWLLHGRSDFDVEEIECMKLFNAVHSLCMVIDKC